MADLTELAAQLADTRRALAATGIVNRRPWSGPAYERARALYSALATADTHLVHLQAALEAEDERDRLLAQLAELDARLT